LANFGFLHAPGTCGKTLHHCLRSQVQVNHLAMKLFLLFSLIASITAAAMPRGDNVDSALAITQVCNQEACRELPALCDSTSTDVAKCVCSTAYYVQFQSCWAQCVAPSASSGNQQTAAWQTAAWSSVMSPLKLTNACSSAGYVFAVPIAGKPGVTKPIATINTNITKIEQSVIAVESQCPTCQALVPMCNATTQDLAGCACSTGFYAQYSKCLPACLARDSASDSSSSGWEKVLSPAKFTEACTTAGFVFAVPATKPSNVGILDTSKSQIKSNDAYKFAATLFLATLL